MVTGYHFNEADSAYNRATTKYAFVVSENFSVLSVWKRIITPPLSRLNSKICNLLKEIGLSGHMTWQAPKTKARDME